MKEEKERSVPKTDPATGLDGIFRGLGTLLETAAQLADITDEAAELRRTSSIGTAGTRAVYGVSVRVGPAAHPRAGNLRPRTVGKSAGCEFREPITDLLDEGDHFLIVAELPGMEESAVHWTLTGQTVVISAQGGERRYRKVLALPTSVSDHDAISHFKNGILELRLCKRNLR